MKLFNQVLLIIFLSLLLNSCITPKSHFTEEIRKKVETSGIEVGKLQFYVDRDVELRRELVSGDAKVTSGKIKFENGKYIHIIILKEGTPGICTKVNSKDLAISFEVGDKKSLFFGVSNSVDPTTIYHIYAQEWIDRVGKVSYDNQIYYIQHYGSNAQLMIKKSIVDKLKVKKRVMKGRKIQ